MAKGFADTELQARRIIGDIRNGVFSPVYLLYGEEPYYIDLVSDEIIEHAVPEEERDFNQVIYYGSDTDADTVITAARRYPMFAERQLVVLKQAQAMKTFDDLGLYFSRPLESTVLVICVNGKVDERRTFFKTAKKVGEVLMSIPVKSYEVARWIDSFYNGKGLHIDPDAAALLGEYAGTDLSKISVETDKLLKNLPDGATKVTVSDIEKNVGMSRQYSIFELTKELSYRNAAGALKIAAHLGASPKFAIPMAVSSLFNHFYRILKYEALLMKTNNRPTSDQKAAALGVNPYFYQEYDTAVRNYPLTKCMGVIALLKEFDFKGKGGFAGEATPDQILIELIAKILNI